MSTYVSHSRGGPSVRVPEGRSSRFETLQPLCIFDRITHNSHYTLIPKVNSRKRFCDRDGQLKFHQHSAYGRQRRWRTWTTRSSLQGWISVADNYFFQASIYRRAVVGNHKILLRPRSSSFVLGEKSSGSSRGVLNFLSFTGGSILSRRAVPKPVWRKSKKTSIFSSFMHHQFTTINTINRLKLDSVEPTMR